MVHKKIRKGLRKIGRTIGSAVGIETPGLENERNKALKGKENVFNTQIEDFRSFGDQASTEIAGLQTGTKELVDSFTRDTISADLSGLDQFQGVADTGINAFNQGVSGIESLLQDPSSILNDPLIQEQLNQGILASERGAAAGGTQLSGGQLKELQNFGNVFAGTQIDNQFNRLSGLANFGLQGANLGLNAEQFGINADIGVQQANQSGLQNFQQLQLQGQEQFANLGLAGIGLRGDVQSTIFQTAADTLSGQRANRANQASGSLAPLIGAGLGAFLGK